MVREKPNHDLIEKTPPFGGAFLEQERRTSLFEEVATLGVQTWLTGTDAAIFSPLKGKALFLRVTDGVIENINQLD